MDLQFGTLSQRCQWVDGVLLVMKQKANENLPFHRITTLNTFIDQVEDMSTYGNFLDGKDLNLSSPTWMKPLLDSTAAWNQPMHLRFTQKAKQGKEGLPMVIIDDKGMTIIQSPTWTSQGYPI